MTMIYLAFTAAIRYNKKVVISKTKLPFTLPRIFEFTDEALSGTEFPSNNLTTCFDFSKENDYIIKGFVWPQVHYVNHEIAPWLREKFSYHAAYFLGNYMFGGSAPDNCKFTEPQEAIEGWSFPLNKGKLIKVEEYPNYFVHCNLSQKAAVVTNDNTDANKFRSVHQYDHSKDDETFCAIQKLISSKKIHQTFGSRVGFWSAALQGRNGSFLNTIDKVCVNTLHSQTGSIWHTFCKGYETSKQPVPDFYPINDYYYICGPNAHDARLFLEYLLW
jgi:hypothetical protein